MLSSILVQIKKFFRRFFLYKIYGFSSYIYAILIALTACSYYHYLDVLYVVDPILDADALREYTILEKLTLRVKVDDDSLITDNLKRYIEKYSLCQSVHEIQVLWPSGGSPPPPLSTFTFAHTHSLVNFYMVDKNTMDSSMLLLSSNIETDGIFLLDNSIEISCNDMKLLQSAWRSSQTVAVGLLPRLHSLSLSSKKQKENSSANRVMSYLDWYYVWWNGKFSLLLSNALIMHKRQLKDYFIENDWNKKFIESHPQCSLVAPSFYLSFINNAAPIWVDISYSYASSRANIMKKIESNPITDLGIPTELSGSDSYLSECLTALSRHYGVNYLPFSNRKSVLAKAQLFW